MRVIQSPKLGKKKKVCVVFPRGMIEDIELDIKKRGGTKKDRSMWVCDAIRKLITLNKGHIDRIKDEWIEAGNNERITIYLDATTENSIKSLIEDLSKKRIEIKDARSSIIRTAALQKLIKGY